MHYVRRSIPRLPFLTLVILKMRPSLRVSHAVCVGANVGGVWNASLRLSERDNFCYFQRRPGSRSLHGYRGSRGRSSRRGRGHGWGRREGRQGEAAFRGKKDCSSSCTRGCIPCVTADVVLRDFAEVLTPEISLGRQPENNWLMRSMRLRSDTHMESTP